MNTDKIAEPILGQFERLIQSYKTLTLVFLIALFIEGILLIFFFPFLVKSAFFAITLAALLITLFSFYTLRNYQSTEKEEAMRELAQKYVKGVLSLHGTKPLKDLKEISAQACLALAHSLQAKPPRPTTKVASFLKPFSKKFETLIDGNETRRFQEILFQKAIGDLSAQVRLAPCDVNVHARLAEAYSLTSELWVESKSPSYFEYKTKALEELKILSELAPKELGILEQLAKTYHDLRDFVSEISIYEKILSLDPLNGHTLLRLGRLYFEQGQTSKGFKVYEALKSIDLIKSDQLISYYQ